MAAQRGYTADFIERKLGVAKALNDGGCGGDYADACLIIATLISGVAADIWPGENIDRKRFIEVWVKHAEPALRPNRVSLSLLVRRLRKHHRTSEAQAVEAMRPAAFKGANAYRLLTGDDDADVQEVRTQCASISEEFVRNRTYPVIFYEHVRSDLVHENHFGARVSGAAMVSGSSAISYANKSDLNALGDPPQRLIHFHMPWLIEVARSIATNAQVDVATPPQVPAKWWAPTKAAV